MRKYFNRVLLSSLFVIGCAATNTALGYPIQSMSAFKSTSSPAWNGAISESVVNVSDGAQTQPVTFVRINTHNPHVIVNASLADNRLGHASTLTQLAQSQHAVAAINGGFFRDYSDEMPESTVMVSGEYAHLWGPCLLGVKKDGSLKMVRGQEALYVAFHNDWTNQIHAWGLNSWQGKPGEIDVFNHFYGPSTKIHDATAVVVQKGAVTTVHHGDTAIPNNGFVVVFSEASDWNEKWISQLTVGDVAGMKVGITDLNGTSNGVDFTDATCAIGAGPMLVDKGRIVLSPALEHLTDPSLLNPVTRRSFLGIDLKGNLILATVRFASIAQLARIALNMHLREAMNLDGGSSSGLYFNGQTLLTPGRKVARLDCVVSLSEKTSRSR